MVANPFRRAPAPRVAAAAPLTPGYRRAVKKLRQPWQERAAYFAANLGAARFASGVSADACSRCDLRIEKLVDPAQDTWEPADLNLLDDLLHTYKGKRQTQRELVREHAWLEDTVGEGYQIVEQDGRKAVWSMVSPFTVEFMGEEAMIRDAPGGSERDGLARRLPAAQVRRVWIPDETWPALATSPLHGVMEDCELYWTVMAKMRRDTSSALIGNGILWTPSEAHTELARKETEPGGPSRPGTDLERDYYAVAQRAYEEGDSIEANAPIMWRWAAALGPPQKIDLAKELDSHSIAYLTTSLEGIARGLNYPARLLIDDGKDTNHWGVWLMKEDFAKEAVAPKMERIAWGDITASFLTPALRAFVARGLFTDDPERYRVGFDMTPIVVHPDQSKTALELYKLGVASDSTVLEMSGLDESAAPNRQELGRWIARTQVMRESIRPQTTQVTPVEATNVLEQTPQGPPDMESAPAPDVTATAALNARSRVRETVLVGPMAGEECGWLD